MINQLELLEKRYEELNILMAEPAIATDIPRLQDLAKEQASLTEIVQKYREYKKIFSELETTRMMLDDTLDPELLMLTREEISKLKERLQVTQEALKQALIPKDPNDKKNVIVEIRAGTGGDEAALFAADLFRAYTRYAQNKGWNTEVIDYNEIGIGGFKEIIFEIRGKGVFSRLKWERGVHRVQRVPVTETSGRIHTSTATVAVLPEVVEVEVSVKPEDLKVEFYHSSGAGGQNVNKVATAVRITHISTGITAQCQDERSQLRNRQKAMAVLLARVYEREQQKKQEAMSTEIRSQVGSGERAEKIRTYNFPQDRVTDHRIGLTAHNLPAILEGNLDSIINALIASEYDKIDTLSTRYDKTAKATSN